MRKTYLILIIYSLLSFSCIKHENPQINNNTLIIDGRYFKIVKGSDGHDYYVYYWSRGASFEHYVDCKFCAKRMKTK